MAAPRYTLADLRARRSQIEEVAARHHASNVRVIGSVARGDADEASDIDLLVDMDRDGLPHGFAYFGEIERLKEELSEVLGCTVDIVDAVSFRSKASALPSILKMRDRMLRDAVAL